MPAQNIFNREKQSLELLKKMEPSNLTSKELYIERVKEVNNDTTNTIIPEAASHSELNKREDEPQRVTLSQWITTCILCFVNLINYMDRFTIAGVLANVTSHFQVGDDLGGLLQTAFVLSYMLFAPAFGYLGDRYSRRLIMAFGVFLWSLTTMAGSFMESYGSFLFFRMLVGIGEASYSTVAPTIISDLFAKGMRSRMLAAFYFAIPVGSGLGYIVGSKMTQVMNNWQWSLRVTPFAGIIAVVLILFVMEEPPRGLSEGRSHLQATSWKEDIVILLKNRSYMLSTVGFTCVAFVTGALAWFGPMLIHRAMKLQADYRDTELSTVSLVFGLLTMISGLIGVPLGMWLSQRLREKYEQADPLICGVGLLAGAPFLFFASCLSSVNIPVSYMLMFIGEVLLNLNWSIVADVLLYIVAPTRRATASAFQILVSHMFGDAGSPYLIGVLSVVFRNILSGGTTAASVDLLSFSKDSNAVSPDVDFRSLQYALFLTCFVEVLGGLFFLLTALHVVDDRAEAERHLRGEDNPVANSDLYSDASDTETGKRQAYHTGD